MLLGVVGLGELVGSGGYGEERQIGVQGELRPVERAVRVALGWSSRCKEGREESPATSQTDYLDHLHLGCSIIQGITQSDKPALVATILLLCLLGTI